MRITVENARVLASSLVHCATVAENARQPDFDLLDSLAALDDQARDALAAAIAQAGSQASGN
jgi:hypothetical protein